PWSDVVLLVARGAAPLRIASPSTGPARTGCDTLSLHDALPISAARRQGGPATWPSRPTEPCGPGGATPARGGWATAPLRAALSPDRKSTRLNSSHVSISYAVLCLKKKTSSGRPDETLTQQPQPS